MRRYGPFLVVWVGVLGAACSDSGNDPLLSADASDAAPADLVEASDDGGQDGSDEEARGTGDNAAPAASDGGAVDAPVVSCSIQQTMSAPAHAAHSGGFSGTDSAFFGLYGGACDSASDCTTQCVAAGGTTDSCTIGAQCTPGEAMDGGLGCTPPTYWYTTSLALSESGTTATAAQLILVVDPYGDSLVLTDFGVSIPDGAMITGIQVKIRKATLTGNAVDASVDLLENGKPVGENRAQPQAWPQSLEPTSYGGAYDLWGTSWTPADVRSKGFGVAISPRYTGPEAGNERAYIDSVRVTVYYRPPCL